MIATRIFRPARRRIRPAMFGGDMRGGRLISGMLRWLR
jgi:hypothetical protein